MVAYNKIMEKIDEMDKVFKALADTNRRKLLDQLFEKKWADAKRAMRAFGYDPPISYKALNHIRGGEPYHC